MYDEALKILNHLPVRRNDPENNYIEHLLGALKALDACDMHVRGFAMLPLHLLFLLAIQCKLLRIAQEKKDLYSLSITLKRIRDGEEELLAPVSPFSFSFFNESELADLCKSIGLPKEGVGRIKRLVQYRNQNLAHAKGYVEMSPDGKVAEYIETLDMLQLHMLPLNDDIAKEWDMNITPEDDVREFVETRLLDSYLCPADFAKGLLSGRFAVI